jgi:hypothetical protein
VKRGARCCTTAAIASAGSAGWKFDAVVVRSTSRASTVTPTSRTAPRRRYGSRVGFNPFREQVKHRSDVFLLAGALVVVVALVLWALLG